MTSDFFTKACLLIYESVTNFVASFPLQITKPIIWQLLFSQCKQPRLVKPWLNFDINVIFKSCGTPLVQVNRAFKSYFLSQSRQVLHESFLTSILEVPISPISKSMPLFSTATSFHGSSLFLNPYFARDVFLKNLLLCHSSRNQKLFWRRHSQNLVRGHEKNSNYGVEITGRDICEPKNWISSFLPIPPSQTLPQAEGNYPFHPTSISWESIFSPSRKGGGLWSWKMTKLKLVKVLATSFDKFQHLATFTFLISVFLCHNLDSVMLKGEGCLT